MPEPAPHEGANADPAAPLNMRMLDGRGWLRLRSWIPEHCAGTRAVTLSGHEFPARVGAILSAEGRVLCLAPADWLIVADARVIASLRERLEPQTRQQGLALVDLTHAFLALLVQGPAARDLLSKGCGVDMHPRSFLPRQCTRTRLAQIPVIIECIGESQFELCVARSYRVYLQSWLADAASEFQKDGA